MKILKQYLSRTVINAICVVTTVFVGLDVFIAFVSELPSIGKGSYGIWQAFLYVLLSMPSQVYLLFPMIGLLGCLIGLGTLASHNELIVLRASGVSKQRIMRIVMTAAFIVMLVVTLLGETLGPYLHHVAVRNKALAQNNGQALNVGNSMWVRDGNSFINIAQVAKQNQLQGVTVYQFNSQHELSQVLFAQSAHYSDGHWQLQRIKQTFLTIKRVHSVTKTALPWAVKFTPQIFRVAEEDPAEMNLATLWEYIRGQKANGLQVPIYQVNFWQRVFQPLAMLVMMFLAIPFVFGSLRDMTMGFRVFMGVIVGLIFYMLSNFMGQLSIVIQMPAAVAALLPILLFAFIGWLLVYFRR